MEKYLNSEQEAQFKQMLSKEAPETQPSTEETPPAEDTGANPAVDTAPAAPATPAIDPNAAILEEHGFSSVAELAEAFKTATSQSGQYKEMLSQMLAMQQALDNEAELDPNDPLNTVKQAVREEMAPLYDKMKRDAQNKLVQEAWGKDAVNLPGVTDMMPEITAFIQEHPELAIANDGLRRAYEGVRSKNYRTEAQMLADDEFIGRMANNDKIKEAVIKEYLAETARNGDNVPASIGGGGNVPLTGKKQPPNSMEQAKSGLAKMLGLK